MTDGGQAGAGARPRRVTPSAQVLLAPNPDWVRQQMPGGKLPDRSDFQRFLDDEPARIALWRRGLGQAQRLADDFAELAAQPSIEALPLA